MLMMKRESDAQAAHFLLQEFLSLDTPEGHRAELIDGEIVVTPPPYGTHEHIVGRVAKQVFLKSSTEMDFAGQKGLIVPDRGLVEAGRVIPDATFAPAHRCLFLGADPWMPAAGVAMVVEVTSSHAAYDREAKRHSYAGAKIPLYLLVDREVSRVTLFRDPAGDDYSSMTIESFGGGIKLPEPFSFILETAEFIEKSN
jgi:Uma2 family endonuclease